MNLLARILSHGFALAVVVLLGIALMYQGDLFPEWELPEFLVVKNESQGGASPAADAADSTVDRTEQQATAVVETAEDTTVEDVATSAPPAPPSETPAADVEQQALTQDTMLPEGVTGESADDAQEIAATGDVPDAPDEAADEVPVEPVVADADSVAEAETAAVTSEDVPDEAAGEAAGETVISQAGEEAAASTATDAAGNPETSQAEQSSGDTDVSATAQAADRQPVAVMPPPPPAPVADAVAGSSAYGLLAAAREAYWLRDYEQAEASYQQLIQLEPDNPDGYGELGNMYFAQGQWQPAAAAYYEAGVRLLNSGMVVQARQMLEVIRGLNGEQADELEQQINQLQQAAPPTGQ